MDALSKAQSTKSNLYMAAANTALRDFEYFAERCIFIRNKEGRVVPLKLNRVQKKLFMEIEKQVREGRPVRIIIVKARQMGISTLIQAYILWRMVRQPNVRCIELAHKRDAAEKILEINRFAFQHLPSWFVVVRNLKVDYFSKYEISFAGWGSSLEIASADGNEPGRGSTYHIAHLSEAAFYPTGKNIERPLLASIPQTRNTAVFIESTGNGPAGSFYNRFMKAWNAEKQGRHHAWKAIFFPWYEHEEYQMPVPDGIEVYCPPELEHLNLTKEQLYWRQWMIENYYNGDEDAFRLEFPATIEEAFMRSDANIFNPQAILKRMREIESVHVEEGFLAQTTLSSKPQFFPQRGESLKIFVPPVPGRQYVIGADTGSGVVVNGEGDYSSADVLDVVTGEQVAHLHMLAETSTYAQELRLLAMYYNDAFIAVEADGHGLAVLGWLRDQGYTNLYRRRVYDKLNNIWVDKLGWSTTPRTKKFIIDNLRADFYNGSIIINCKETLEEMSTFVKHADKKDYIGAINGAHDDRVMSLAIANQVRREYSQLVGKPLQETQAPPPQVSLPEGSETSLAAKVRAAYARSSVHPILGRCF